MMAKLLTFLLLCVLPLAGAADLKTDTKPGTVNLEWRPAETTTGPGESFELSLFAVSNDGQAHPFTWGNVVFQWNPLELDFVGLVDAGDHDWSYADFPAGGWNASFDDGDAWLLLAVGAYDRPSATPEGFRLATFEFTMTGGGDTTVELVCDDAHFTHTRLEGRYGDLVAECGVASVVNVCSLASYPTETLLDELDRRRVDSERSER